MMECDVFETRMGLRAMERLQAHFDWKVSAQ